MCPSAFDYTSEARSSAMYCLNLCIVRADSATVTQSGFMCVLSHVLTLRPHGLLPARLLCPWDFSECWSGLPFLSPRDVDPGIKPASPALVGILTSVPPGKTAGFILVPNFMTKMSLSRRTKLC